MQNRPKIHPLVWFLLVGTFLSRVALFITLPFISIYITTKLGVSPSLTGVIAGLGPLCGIVSAFLMGYVSDKIGRHQILILSLLIWSLAFFGFSLSTAIWQFALFNMFYGMSRASFESVASALITDLTEKSLRKKIFHYRYFAINLGACIAPPIGAWMFVQHPKYSFMITSGVYFLYGVLLMIFIKRYRPKKAGPAEIKKPIKFIEVIHILRKDHPLFLFLLGNILMLIGFSQIETNLPIFLQGLFGQPGIKLFSYVILTNAITVVCLQFAINNWIKKLKLIHIITFGFLIYGIGTAAFGMAHHSRYLFCLAMFVFSIGEILVFSNTSLLIDQIGPAHLKGSYFGIMELCSLGFVMGPYIGGIFLEHGYGNLMFFIMGSLSLFSIIAYQYGNRLLGTRLSQ
jgi:MFS family permease